MTGRQDHDSGGCSWTIVRRPAAALGELVRQIADFALDRPMPPTLAPAELVVPVVVNFAAPFRISTTGLPGSGQMADSFVAGLTAGPVAMAADAATRCLQIDLTPPGALRLLRRPLADLTGGLVPLDALSDPGLADLATRRAETAAAADRLDRAEGFLRTRLLAGPGPADPRLDAAYAALATGRGGSVAGLAERTGLCRQTLSRRLAESYGLPPRTLARIGRYQRARALALAGRASGWADLAALAGYADQAHLVREYRALGGTTPGRWRGP